MLEIYKHSAKTKSYRPRVRAGRDNHYPTERYESRYVIRYQTALNKITYKIMNEIFPFIPP